MTTTVPTPTTPYRSTVTAGGDGFHRIVRAEWTKLRSVPRWAVTMMVGVALTVLIGVLVAFGAGGVHAESGSGGADKVAPPPLGVLDQGHFAQTGLVGDGELVARVVAQDRGSPWAKAGLMIRADERPGGAYAALVVTPDHGVRWQTGFDTSTAGPAGTAPQWLRLVRAGDTVTGYASTDGASWQRVGEAGLSGLPDTASIGMFVASPDRVEVKRRFGGEGIDQRGTEGRATFDHVTLTPAHGRAGPTTWSERARSAHENGFTRADGVYTLTGFGDIGRDEFADDLTNTVLGGFLVGLVAIVAVAALFVTSEYHRDTMRTTFAASPRRGRVLAAKAVVIGGVTFVVGLVAAFGVFAVTAPVLRSENRTPADMGDPEVLRALVGSAALLAVVAVFTLSLAVVLRRGAAAVTAVLLLLLVPPIVSTGLPLSAAGWLERATPAAGFAIQTTVERYDQAITPWAGLGVLCAYTACAFVLALWLLRRRDA